MSAAKDWFFANIFPLVPKRLLSRATGRVMRTPLPPVVARFLIPKFARAFGMNVEEAELPAHHYGSLNAFFTRRLKLDARPIGGEVVHPVDGRLTEHGPIARGELVQAKGWTYDLAEFVGDSARAAALMGGSFYHYYLCPADYHRIHAATGGELTSARHIPGALWPVNEWSVRNVRRLFNLNERVVLNFLGPRGPWTMVLVGATNVGDITVTLDPSIITRHWRWGEASERRYAPGLPVQTGDEVGTFHLGSTVICIFGPGYLPSLRVAGPVRMGESLYA